MREHKGAYAMARTAWETVTVNGDDWSIKCIEGLWVAVHFGIRLDKPTAHSREALLRLLAGEERTAKEQR